MRNYFKEINHIEKEKERLIREYKKSEYLYYTVDSEELKEEARLNMLDIQSKIDELKFEIEEINKCLNDMVNQGIMI